MFDKLLGSLVDKEQASKDAITDALEAAAAEFGLKHDELTFMIRPINAEFEFKVWIVRLENGAPKKVLREITVKEIVGEADEKGKSGG